MPEPNRSHPTQTAIPLLFPIGHVPFFSGLLGLVPCASAFPCSGVRSHRTLGALQSRSSDLRMFSVLRPDRRGEPVVTTCNSRVVSSFKFSSGHFPGKEVCLVVIAASRRGLVISLTAATWDNNTKKEENVAHPNEAKVSTRIYDLCFVVRYSIIDSFFFFWTSDKHYVATDKSSST